MLNGFSHPEIDGGHSAEKSFLTTATLPGGASFKNSILFYGSNMGNASSRDNRNLPVILAGGGFRHGQHLAFDQTNNQPLANLYVSMLLRLGIEADRFGSGKTTLPGLELT